MTIRWRVTAMAMAAVAAVLLVAGFAIVQVHSRVLTDAVDERLEEAAEAVRAATRAGERPPPVARPADDDSVAQLVVDGVVVASAPPGLDDPIAPAPNGQDDDEVVRTVDGVVPDEGTYRVLTADLGDGQVLHLGATLDDVEESATALRWALLLSVPLVAVALGAVTWWVVGRALRPVEAIRAQVGAIGGTDLHRRVPEPGTDDEISRLARTMNGMLDRLEQAADQQRRFVADASHELRSPLTRMRAELEVDAAHPQAADRAATHESVLAEVIALQHLVDDLLRLARHDGQGARPATTGPVDLDDLVLAAARRVRAAGRVVVDTAGVGAARVEGDAGQLQRCVSNLLDNAVRHAQTRVTIELRDLGDGSVELVVDDDGPGIPLDERDHVFDAFTRLDEARAAGAGGAGLGLAIVRDAVTAHGGTVAVSDRPGGGARFVVRLPSAT